MKNEVRYFKFHDNIEKGIYYIVYPNGDWKYIATQEAVNDVKSGQNIIYTAKDDWDKYVMGKRAVELTKEELALMI